MSYGQSRVEPPAAFDVRPARTSALVSESVRATLDRQSAAIWILRNGKLHWFTFAARCDVHSLARRVRTTFSVPVVVMPFWWEPEVVIGKEVACQH